MLNATNGQFFRLLKLHNRIDYYGSGEITNDLTTKEAVLTLQSRSS